MEKDMSPLWCADDSPHPAHTELNEFGGHNYCSGRPTPATTPSPLENITAVKPTVIPCTAEEIGEVIYAHSESPIDSETCDCGAPIYGDLTSHQADEIFKLLKTLSAEDAIEKYRQGPVGRFVLGKLEGVFNNGLHDKSITEAWERVAIFFVSGNSSLPTPDDFVNPTQEDLDTLDEIIKTGFWHPPVAAKWEGLMREVQYLFETQKEDS